ncbi:UDP-glucose 6-dehydrogenase [Pseudomonas aeruginosa]|uniref:UDP-glucose 6-dehydrogenase n=1 Tax=Pseudomonas aeruginosa TaxID=287 RepID=UPI0005BDA2DF|nr:UDP-glucose 6-dehydrogenase [Pseudomonas aeruginosa]
MKISVFGSGYVGLVQAAVLAEVGHDVLCMDIDRNKVERLAQGLASIYEPGLDALLREGLDSGRLRFSSDARLAVEHGRVQFIAVGTPPGEDGAADLGAVFAVADTIAEHRRKPVIVVEKSTVPVGTGDRLRAHIERRLEADGRELEFEIVSNPEFLKEGSAVVDCRRPDRIVVGCDNEEVRQVMRELYEPFNRNHDRMLFMGLRSAELTKYAANGMLATKISFINQIAELAEHLGADIEAVRQGIGADPRIGYHFIYPGCGYGGSCFPKDIRALIRSAEQQGFDSQILRAVEARNARQKELLFETLGELFQGRWQGRTVALWGLAFKPGTDDLREAPSLVLLEALLRHGVRVRAHDPVANAGVAARYPDALACAQLTLHDSPYAAVEGADALVLVTEWKQFRQPDFQKIRGSMRTPLLVDGRNLYAPARMAELGFIYQGIGRPRAGHCKASAA